MSAEITAPLQRFSFDTVFDDAGDVLRYTPRPKRSYSPEEVEAIRAQAFAEGQQSVTAVAEAEAAAALNAIAGALGHAMQALAQTAHEHRQGSAELALAAARIIAGAALERFPEAPAAAALDALSREIEAAPRLIVRTTADLADRMRAALDPVADAIGFAGQLTVATDPDLAGAAFVFDWGEGRAAYDPEQAASRMQAAVSAALAAEGLHADPLIPAHGNPEHG